MHITLAVLTFNIQRYCAKESSFLTRNLRPCSLHSPTLATRCLFPRSNSLSGIRYISHTPIMRSERIELRNGEFIEDTGDFIITSSSPAGMGLVNEPIKLIHDVPPIEVQDKVTSCDGGSGPLGHPKVFLNLAKKGIQVCNYCGLRFVQKQEHHSHH